MPDPEPSVWGPWTAPAAILVGLGIGVLFDVLLGAFAQAAGSSLTHPTPAVSLIGDFLFDISFVVAAVWMVARQARIRAQDFGYRIPALKPALAAFLAAGGAYYVLTYFYGKLFSLHGADKLPSELGVHRSSAALAGAAVFVCVVAPICEEFFFRGFLFGAIRSLRGPWPAAIVTAVLFGLVHAGSASAQYLIPLGVFGFALAMVRWKTDSIYPGMALHSLNNALALGVNDLKWSAIAIVGLAVGGILTIYGITIPISGGARVAAGSAGASL
jgi:membrane protease YdiL (CAAX protease family)